MEAACAAVNTIGITRATREARINGLDIHQRDFLAIIDGVIGAAATDIESALSKALAFIDIEDKELATLYCGAGFAISTANDLIESLLLTIKGIEFEAVHGGQSLYPLLVSIE